MSQQSITANPFLEVDLIILKDHFLFFITVSSLMRSGTGMSAAAAAGVSQMSGLASDKQSAAAAAMQFPLTQRRKRRVLFTQAQVKQTYFKKAVF